MHFTEQHHLLPKIYFGCKVRRKPTNSLHYVMCKIHNDMDMKKVVVVLFLDIKGAFPSINLDKLVYNMHKQGIPKEYTDQIHIKIGNRHMCLVFNSYIYDLLSFLCGTDQGCLLLGIFFQFYNADLLNIPDTHNNKDKVVFVDNTAYSAMTDKMDKATLKLKDIIEQCSRVFEWADSHNCSFAINKFALIGFMREQKKVKARQYPYTREENRRQGTKEKKFEYQALKCPSISLRGTLIKPSKSHKFLGMVINQELNFKEHATIVLAKGMKWVSLYR